MRNVYGMRTIYLKQIHAMQLTDTLIVLSTMEETFYQSLGLNARYIPNSVGYLASAGRKSENKSKNVLWVGRLDWLKNYQDALEIMKGTGCTSPFI